jgi:hypothetical protein
MLPIAEALPVETTQPTEIPTIEPVLADEYTAADVDVSRPTSIRLRFRGSGPRCVRTEMLEVVISQRGKSNGSSCSRRGGWSTLWT